MFECDPVKERNKKNKISIQRKKTERTSEIYQSSAILFKICGRKSKQYMERVSKTSTIVVCDSFEDRCEQTNTPKAKLDGLGRD